jgi:hypothetical protein
MRNEQSLAERRLSLALEQAWETSCAQQWITRPLFGAESRTSWTADLGELVSFLEYGMLGPKADVERHLHLEEE